jgi:hypothetical protein
MVPTSSADGISASPLIKLEGFGNILVVAVAVVVVCRGVVECPKSVFCVDGMSLSIRFQASLSGKAQRVRWMTAPNACLARDSPHFLIFSFPNIFTLQK